MSSRRRWLVAVLFVVSLAPYLYTVFDDSDGDIPLYHTYATKLFDGQVPYRDFTFEYPPFALLGLLLPKLIAALWSAKDSYAVFRIAFSLQILALDVVTKVTLLRAANRLAPQGRRLVPFLAFAVLGVFHSYFYLKRFDAPAAIATLFALLLVAKERFAAGGALLVLGAGIKLYPALLGPALLVFAGHKGKVRPFVTGALAALVPVGVLSLFAPWWSFASFHIGRGLQAESLYASLIWLGHFFGVEARWASAPGCLEVDGPTSQAILPIARFIFGVATLASVAFSAWITWRRRRDADLRFLVRATTFPVVGFMIFNIVLSPQYLAWLIGPVALLLAVRPRGAAIVLALAVVLTTLVFPAPHYFSAEGIGLVTTVILVARNVVLLVGFAWLGRELAVAHRTEERGAVGG